MKGNVQECDSETCRAGQAVGKVVGMTYIYYFMAVDLLLHKASVNSGFILRT
jgi:hypothetical protein